MSHTVNPDREYRLLQQRLDRNVTGAPDSPAFTRILELLFSPEEAKLAQRIPSQPIPVRALAKKLGMPEDELDGKIVDMARRGIVIDFEHKGRRYCLLAPVVIGFFEFTFMRAHDDLPMVELSRLFEEYMKDGGFDQAVFSGETQIGRSLPHEEALPEGDHTEILDWERATRLVETASDAAVSLCACRHKASHLGKACDAPMNNCLALNFAAGSLVRNGLADRVSRDEAMRILEEAKACGLAQTGDNVQKNVSYICNCCGCCCGMMMAINTLNMPHAIVTSNWITVIDEAACKGCGLCAKACPIDAIDMAETQTADGKKRKKAVLNKDLCLGCGVCYSACKFGAIAMKPRPKRVYTPESVFDRVIAMAVERGKLANVLFENPETLSQRAMARALHILELSPPYKAAMAIKPLRSAFLNTLVKKGKRMTGEAGKAVE